MRHRAGRTGAEVSGEGRRARYRAMGRCAYKGKERAVRSYYTPKMIILI